MIDRQRLLGHLREDERLLGAKVVDRMEASLQDGKPRATDFMDPREREIAEAVAGSVLELKFFATGGYKRAERRRLVVYPTYFLDELIEAPVAAIALEGDFGVDGAAHPDVLGSVLATGLSRAKLGDVIVSPEACQVIAAAESVDFLVAQVTRVGAVPVRASVIELEQLAVPPERTKEIRATVASLRLDAVASSGFGMSRTRMARDIKAERVRLNWRPVVDPAAEVKAGDVISIRGRGRVVLEQISGPTRKGRTGLTLKRLI